MTEQVQEQTLVTVNSTEKIIDICLDATMLDTFLDCPAKFNYRFNMNRHTLVKATPLDKGDLIHKGFEPYYLALKEKNSFEEALEKAKKGFDIATIDSDLEPDDIRNMKNSLIESIHFWRNVDFRYEVLAVESPFAYVLYTDNYIRITMIGKIDLLVNDGAYRNMPVDHKSYSRDFPLSKLANQFCNYSFACKSNYLLVNRVGLQTSLPPEKKHKRQPLSYDSIFLNQWKQNVIEWCYDYVNCVADNKWRMNTTSCTKYNRICEYYDVCNSSGIDAKIYKLNTDFKDGPKWDVAKSLGLKK